MRSEWGLAAVLAVSVACAGPGDSDSDTDHVQIETGDTGFDGCDQTSVYVDGPDEPQVDDVWTVLLRCDGTTVQGPMVLRIEPPELAFLEENTLRFLEVGEGVVKVQVGALRAERPVTVRR